MHTLGHEFSHLRAGEETTQGGILKNALPYPVNEQYYRRSLATGDTVAADVRSDRGRQAAPSSEIDWKSIRDISIYSDADASARKKELDARVLTSTLLLYATTPPDESLDPKHHSGGITEQKLDESSEERAAVAAFLSNTDGDGVTRVVQKVVKLYHLDGLQRVCLSRPTHNPKHRTRQVRGQGIITLCPFGCAVCLWARSIAQHYDGDMSSHILSVLTQYPFFKMCISGIILQGRCIPFNARENH